MGNGLQVRETRLVGTSIEEVIDSRGNVHATLRLIDETATEKIYLVTVSDYRVNGDLERQSRPFYFFGAEGRYLARPASEDSADLNSWAIVREFLDDGSGRLLSERGADGGVTSFEYDDENGVVIVTDPHGVKQIRNTDPESGLTIETYTLKADVEGDLEGIKYDHIIHYYDEDRRQIRQSQRFSDGTEIPLSETGYDSAGRTIWTRANGGPTSNYEYDENGQRILNWRVVGRNGSSQIILVNRAWYDLDGSPVATLLGTEWGTDFCDLRIHD